MGHLIRESLLSTGDATLYVRDTGEGRPIVVVHGGPDFNHEYLLPELDDLAASFRVVSYDQRGRGRSFRNGHRPEVTIATEVADLDYVRAWTGSRAVALLGHSWGALLALEYALRHPDRVSHLILMNAAPVSVPGAVAFRREVAARTAPDQRERMRRLTAEPSYRRGELEADAEYYRIHFGGTLRRPDQLADLVGRLRRSFTPEAIVAAREIEQTLYSQTWSREAYDLIPSLRRLDTPTLIIHGSDDFIPLETARELAAALPHASLQVLDACGHFAYIDQRERVMAAITEFAAVPSGS